MDIRLNAEPLFELQSQLLLSPNFSIKLFKAERIGPPSGARVGRMRYFFRTLVPEKFDARVDVQADGSYAYSYSGTLVFVPAVIRAFTVGLNARLDAQLARAVAQLEQEGFRNVTYLGGARYSVTLERACPRGSPSFLHSREMSVFSIRSQLMAQSSLQRPRMTPVLHIS